MLSAGRIVGDGDDVRCDRAQFLLWASPQSLVRASSFPVLFPLTSSKTHASHRNGHSALIASLGALNIVETSHPPKLPHCFCAQSDSVSSGEALPAFPAFPGHARTRGGVFHAPDSGNSSSILPSVATSARSSGTLSSTGGIIGSHPAPGLVVNRRAAAAAGAPGTASTNPALSASTPSTESPRSGRRAAGGKHPFEPLLSSRSSSANGDPQQQRQNNSVSFNVPALMSNKGFESQLLLQGNPLVSLFHGLVLRA